jgi:hypothetical protein
MLPASSSVSDSQVKSHLDFVEERSRHVARKRQSRNIVQLLDFRPQVCRSMDIFLLRLAELLRERGWQTVHIFSGEPTETFRSQLQELESPWYQTQFPINWARAWSLARLILSHHPHIIQTSYMSAFNPALWWLKWASHAQYWVVADRSSGACSQKKGLKRLVASARGAMAGRMIDQVVAVSDFVAHRNIEQNMLPRNRVTTIYTVVSRFFCTNSIQTITCISERTLVKLNNVPHQTRRKA